MDAHDVKRQGLIAILIQQGASRDGAERRVRAWEAEAEARGLERGSPDYFKHGAYWIAERFPRTTRT